MFDQSGISEKNNNQKSDYDGDGGFGDVTGKIVKISLVPIRDKKEDENKSVTGSFFPYLINSDKINHEYLNETLFKYQIFNGYVEDLNLIALQDNCFINAIKPVINDNNILDHIRIRFGVNKHLRAYKAVDLDNVCNDYKINLVIHDYDINKENGKNKKHLSRTIRKPGSKLEYLGVSKDESKYIIV
jgi:hypothetical protein